MSIMDDAEDLQYGLQPFLLSLSSNLGVDAGIDDDASMLEAMDWTPWQNLGGGSCPHQDSMDVQAIISAHAKVGTLCNDDSTAFDISALPADPEKSDTAATAPHIHPLGTSFSTQHPLVEDLRMIEVLQPNSQMDSRSFATCGSSEKALTLSVRNRYPTTEDWEFYRPIFSRLYRDENRTLNDVKSIMKDIYGFNATDKMYKKRINDWQLFKNQKAAEKEKIVQHLEVHKKLGVDLGQPMIRGHEVKEHKIARHLRGKRKADGLYSELAATVRDMSVSDPSTRTDDARRGRRARIRRITSCHAISFSRITDPAEYRNTENLLIHIDHYFCSKLGNNPRTTWDIWLKSSMPSGGATRIQYTYQHRTYICTFKGTNDVYQRYASGTACLMDGRTQEGWKLIHEGTEMIRPLLLQENPHFLRHLLALISELALDRYAGILKLLLDLIASMASIVYGEGHPISKMCHALQACRERKDIVYLAQRKLLDTYNHHLGSDHDSSLDCQSTSLGMQVTIQEAKRVCREFIAFCEIKRGRYSFFSRRSLYELALLCYRAGENSEAADILAEVLERGKDHSEIDEVNIAAHTLLGMISRDCEDHSTAEGHLWIGLSRNIFAYGPQDPRTILTYNYYQPVAKRHGAS